MAGLRRICRMYGGMTVSSNGRTINYVWDYANEEPVNEKDMPMGSKRWEASEKAKHKLLKEQMERDAQEVE
jgi:hypothetical protein